MSADPFVDHYELLQISPNADEDTIQRIFRHLAKKLHPDASTNGDPERFNRLLEAYRVLTDVSQRAAYDVAYRQHWEQTWKVAAEASDANPISDDGRVRVRLLSLFYVQRRRNMRNPGMGQSRASRSSSTSRRSISRFISGTCARRAGSSASRRACWRSRPRASTRVSATASSSIPSA